MNCDDLKHYCDKQNENAKIFDNENNNKYISSNIMSYDLDKLIIENSTIDDEINSENINETCNYETNYKNGEITKTYQCKKCKKEYSKLPNKYIYD